MVKFSVIIVGVAIAILAIVLVQNYTGAVTYASCTDSDKGKYVYIKGTVVATPTNGTPVTKVDECTTGDVVSEWYCNAASKEPLTLAYNCPSGCVDGACKGVPPSPSCSDSDGGNNIDVYGIVTSIGVYQDGRTTTNTYKDACYNNTVVREQYCSGVNFVGQTQNCEEGKYCAGGTCKACSDTDGGANYNVKGTVTDSNGAHYDFCDPQNVTVLHERVCAGVDVLSPYDCMTQGKTCKNGACALAPCVPKTCGQLGKSCGTYSNGCGGTVNCGTCATGKVCTNGACVAQCTDTDGGAKYDVKGTVTNATGQFTDNCDAVGAPNWLNEFVCAGAAGRIDCTATGKTCQDGACVAPAAPACVDTDGPWNNATKGTKTNATGQWTDWCWNSTALAEFECSLDGTPGSWWGQDLYGYGAYLKFCRCSNGACV